MVLAQLPSRFERSGIRLRSDLTARSRKKTVFKPLLQGTSDELMSHFSQDSEFKLYLETQKDKIKYYDRFFMPTAKTFGFKETDITFRLLSDLAKGQVNIIPTKTFTF
jgi:hypothetical protein